MRRRLRQGMLAAAVAAGSLQAQTVTAPLAPGTAQRADLFDFWVGDWRVSWRNADGSTGHGRNRIAKVLDGTVLEEQFEEAEGSSAPPVLKGRSLSVLHKASGMWKQAWADNQGGYFNFSAQVDGDKRIFITDVTRADGKATAQRMVFHSIGPDALTWDWESTSDGGTTWLRQWRIDYRRRSRLRAGLKPACRQRAAVFPGTGLGCRRSLSPRESAPARRRPGRVVRA